MAELAYEYEQAAVVGVEAGGSGRDALTSTVDVPDIVGDERLLRLVPWGGDGDDPLSGSVGDGEGRGA